MKLLFGLLISLAISSTFAVPVSSPKDDVDIVEVPRVGTQRSRESTGGAKSDDGSDVDPDFRDFQGVVDTGAGYPFLAPLPHPFSFNLGFFDSFEDIFRRLRTRLWSVGSGETSEEGGFSLGSEPPKGANSTSVVKVVDGHKIEINDTVYGTGDGENGAVFKFRIINIRPLESGEEVPETEKTTNNSEPDTGLATSPKTRDIEGKSDESKEDADKDNETKPDDNEINANIDDPESTTEAITSTEMHEILPHGLVSSLDGNNTIDRDILDNQDELQPDEIDIVEPTAATTTEADDEPSAETFEGVVEYLHPSGYLQHNKPIKDFDDQDIAKLLGQQLSVGEQERLTDEGHSSRREDLSSDDEDNEEDNGDVRNQGLEDEWGNLDDRNVLTNEIDAFERVPVDLSNDIAVNDIMANDQSSPINPDAEIFDVNEYTMNAAGGAMPERRLEALRDSK